MSEPKSFASLTSGLLARKGGAKPAMRRQGTAFPDNNHGEHADADDDLGWNDMVYDVNPDHEADKNGSVNHNPLAGAIPEAVPAVTKQQEEIAEKLSAQQPEDVEPEKAPEPVPPAPVPVSISREIAPIAEQSSIAKTNGKPASRTRKSRPATRSRTRKAKAAFTLRLDADRHLKLRLATAVKNVSAQQLVTKAVDEYLMTIPELDDLAERVPSRGAA